MAKKEKIVKMRLGDLVFEEAVFPRDRINTGHAMDIYESILGQIEAGLVPEGEARDVSAIRAIKDLGIEPIVADMKTLTLVDGHHRRHAFMKFSKDIELPVKLIDFKDAKAMFRYAVTHNTGRGLDIIDFDKKTAVARGLVLKFSEDELSNLLGTTKKVIEEIRKNLHFPKVTPEFLKGLERLGIKESDLPSTQIRPTKKCLEKSLAGKTVTPEQEELNRTVGGTSVYTLLGWMGKHLEAGTVPWYDDEGNYNLKLYARAMEVLELWKREVAANKPPKK
jgi:hypothetical protein